MQSSLNFARTCGSNSGVQKMALMVVFLWEHLLLCVWSAAARCPVWGNSDITSRSWIQTHSSMVQHQCRGKVNRCTRLSHSPDLCAADFQLLQLQLRLIQSQPLCWQPLLKWILVQPPHTLWAPRGCNVTHDVRRQEEENQNLLYVWNYWQSSWPANM